MANWILTKDETGAPLLVNADDDLFAVGPGWTDGTTRLLAKTGTYVYSSEPFTEVVDAILDHNAGCMFWDSYEDMFLSPPPPSVEERLTAENQDLHTEIAELRDRIARYETDETTKEDGVKQWRGRFAGALIVLSVMIVPILLSGTSTTSAAPCTEADIPGGGVVGVCADGSSYARGPFLQRPLEPAPVSQPQAAPLSADQRAQVAIGIATGQHRP